MFHENYTFFDFVHENLTTRQVYIKYNKINANPWNLLDFPFFIIGSDIIAVIINKAGIVKNNIPFEM